jgi:hypothetical protein
MMPKMIIKVSGSLVFKYLILSESNYYKKGFNIFLNFSGSSGKKWRLVRKSFRKSGRRLKERPGEVKSIQPMSSHFR